MPDTPLRPPRGRRKSTHDAFSVDLARMSRFAIVTVIMVGALHYAQEVFIPLVLGVIVSLALNPLVTWLHRYRLPQALGAALVLAAIILSIGTLSYALQDEVEGMLKQAPAVVEKVEEILRLEEGFAGVFQDRKTRATVPSEKGKPPARVEIVEPTIDWREYLWWGTRNALVAGGQIVIVLFLAFFLLSNGELYRAKLSAVVARSEEHAGATAELFAEIQRQVARYLFVLALRVLIVAVLIWAAFSLLGFENAGAWALAAGVLNIVPYIGPAIITVLVALAALLQYGTLLMTATVGGIALVIMSIEEELLLPLLGGRIGRLNPVALLVGLLFWTWLWGIWGALLAVPLMMILKVISERVAGLKSLATLLGA